jgi:RNA polymerase sigma-70 factor (ECF subfamily)
LSDRTRPSLLIRLRDSCDGRSWQAFFDRYWRLIYGFARKCGLSSADSEDVLQDVIIEVFKSMPAFEYDRCRGTFRAYLRTITQREVASGLRSAALRPAERLEEHVRGNGRSPLADPTGPDADEAWEKDWKRNLLLQCLDDVRVEIEPKTYQAFHLYAMLEWPVEEVAEFLKLSVSSVYTAKSRVLARVRERLAKEVAVEAAT